MYSFTLASSSCYIFTEKSFNQIFCINVVKIIYSRFSSSSAGLKVLLILHSIFVLFIYSIWPFCFRLLILQQTVVLYERSQSYT